MILCASDVKEVQNKSIVTFKYIFLKLKQVGTSNGIYGEKIQRT